MKSSMGFFTSIPVLYFFFVIALVEKWISTFNRLEPPVVIFFFFDTLNNSIICFGEQTLTHDK